MQGLHVKIETFVVFALSLLTTLPEHFRPPQGVWSSPQVSVRAVLPRAYKGCSIVIGLA